MKQHIDRWNFFADGIGYVGRISSFTPPNLQINDEEYRGAGMDAPMHIDMGMLALTCSWVADEAIAAMMSKFGLVQSVNTRVAARASVRDPITGLRTGLKYVCGGLLTSVESGEFTPEGSPQFTYTMGVNYYEMVRNLVPVHLIDIANGVRMVNGVDQMAQARILAGG